MFSEGPYKGVSLQVPERYNELLLPCVVSTAMEQLKDKPDPVDVLAVYRLSSYNEMVAVYQFKGFK
jgi:hypothetical protein